MAASFCTNCGARLAASAKFCGDCGSPVITAANEAAADPAVVRESDAPPDIPPPAPPPAVSHGASRGKALLVAAAAGVLVLLALVLLNPFARPAAAPARENGASAARENDLPFMTAETNGLGACARIPVRGGPDAGTIASLENGEWGVNYRDSFVAGQADSFVLVRLPEAAVLRSLPSRRWGRDTYRCAREFTLAGRWVTGQDGTPWLKVGYDGYIAGTMVQELGPARAGQQNAGEAVAPAGTTNGALTADTAPIPLTRDYLVGSWCLNSPSSPSLALRADGTANDSGSWSLDGSTLQVRHGSGEPPETSSVTVVDRDHMRLSGTEVNYFRCD